MEALKVFKIFCAGNNLLEENVKLTLSVCISVCTILGAFYHFEFILIICVRLILIYEIIYRENF